MENPSDRSILRHLGKRNIPDSEGEITGFPYQFLWEEFNSDWETLVLIPELFSQIRNRFEAVRKLSCPVHLRVTQDEISPLLNPLGLSSEENAALAKALHLLAGVYLAPQHRELLGSDATSTLKKLRSLRRSAKQFNDQLAAASAEMSILLERAHPHLVFTAVPSDQFTIGDVMRQSLDVARVADVIIAEFPRRGRGPPANVLRERWIWSAVRAIEALIGEEGIQVLQFDGSERSAQLKGTPAEVLRKYLRLVDPNIRIGTIVRVIVDRRKGAAPTAR